MQYLLAEKREMRMLVQLLRRITQKQMEAITRKARPTSHDTFVLSTILKVTALMAAFVVVPCFFIYNSDLSFQFLSTSSQEKMKGDGLEKVLKSAAMRDKTVILTMVNGAWAANDSLLGMFLGSFEIGDRTQRLLRHLVIISLDQKAYARCLTLHPHCYALYPKDMDFSNEAFYMTPTYLEMMWGRLDFLRSVLQMGYNFLFTDADIMWFRNPFKHFDGKADFQIACDEFNGNSTDINNFPNGGFKYVKSNDRAITFYKYWYSSRQKFPGANEQEVLNKIKYEPFITEIGLKMRFLDTIYYGGFCQPSRDFNKVCTMHANCCVGLGNKLHDLRIMLDDWRKFKSLPPNTSSSWSVPQYCR